MGRYLHYLTYHPSRWAGRERNGMADDIIGNGIDKKEGDSGRAGNGGKGRNGKMKGKGRGRSGSEGRKTALSRNALERRSDTSCRYKCFFLTAYNQKCYHQVQFLSSKYTKMRLSGACSALPEPPAGFRGLLRAGEGLRGG